MTASQNQMENKKIESFLKNSSIIEYSESNFTRNTFVSTDEIILKNSVKSVEWLNVYGFNYQEILKKLIKQNNFDEFLLNLIIDNDQRNKVIELSDCIFLTLKTFHYENSSFYDEQMMFIASPNYVWSIQEKSGDYFEHIRERIAGYKGTIRKKKADYLLYRIIEAIIDNYYLAYEKLVEKSTELKDLSKVKPSPEFAIIIENNKQNLFVLKKAVSSLREAISRIEKLELENFETHYFSELKEQASFLIDDIDFDLQQFESSINLIFNIQNHRLNEVMKTLTIISVIFIPLTFLAGIYGMNFKNMPELDSEFGYFIILAIMILLTLINLYFIKKKKWFD